MTRLFAPAALAATLVLGACASSTPMRYHALAGNGGSGFPEAGSAAMLVEIAPVTLPDRVDRQEIVVTGPDGRIEVLEFDRWAGPLSNEMRLVLDRALWRRLGAVDIYQSPVPKDGNTPHYRLNLTIAGFDARPGDKAVVEGAWTARKLGADKMAVCRFGAVEPLPGQSADEIADALRKGVARLSEALARSVENLERGAADPCAGLEK